MKRKSHGIAMYIQPEEMASRGYAQDAEGFAAYAREALRDEGMSAGGMTLEVFSGAGGIMLFCEPHERTLTRFSAFDDLVAAAGELVSVRPARSALWHTDGAWYLELCDESARVWAATAIAREYGAAATAPSVWLREHATRVAASMAVERLAELA